MFLFYVTTNENQCLKNSLVLDRFINRWMKLCSFQVSESFLMMIFRSWCHIDHVSGARKKIYTFIYDNCEKKIFYVRLFGLLIKFNNNIKAQKNQNTSK